ncbi:hypothetical protein ACGFIF_11965 [Kribbella sp. NPDC049174]|uniref:DUF7144 family membrane protein n=1 Tax=Kribbella sp. NPDC049174 TaxID=3364112 RepID=UPI00370FB696
MAEKGSTALAGVVVFAGSLLLVIGLVNIFQAFIALFADERVVVTRENLVVVDITAWGWVLLISGLLMLAVGAGLLVTQTWARIAGIVLVCLHAVTQIAWLGAYPVWSVMMIALDIVILFALTVRWSEVRDRLGGVGESTWGSPEAGEYSAATSERTPPPLV